jgi:hypothetical protein
MTLFQNLDGQGTFASLLNIDTANEFESIFPADADDDGDIDIFSGGFSQLNYEENNLDKNSSFVGKSNLVSGSERVRAVHGADLDLDGDEDLIAGGASCDTCSDGFLTWFENVDGAGDYQKKVDIALGNVVNAIFVDDMDGDGDPDVLVAAPGEITWFENTDRMGGFVSRVVSAGVDQATAVVQVDVDRDGDLDILSASSDDNTVAWYKNKTIHRSAVYPSEAAIAGPAAGATAPPTALGDVDDDGDLDLIAGGTGPIRIFTNDGEGDPWDTTGAFDATTDNDDTRALALVDIDHDGDRDLIAGNSGTPIRLYLNNGTDTPFAGVTSMATETMT